MSDHAVLTANERASASPIIPSFFGDDLTETCGRNLRLCSVWAPGLPERSPYGRNRALSTDLHIYADPEYRPTPPPRRGETVVYDCREIVRPDEPDLLFASPYGAPLVFRLHRDILPYSQDRYCSESGFPPLFRWCDPEGEIPVSIDRWRGGSCLHQSFPNGGKLTYRCHDLNALREKYELARVVGVDGFVTEYVYGAAGHPALLREIILPSGRRVELVYTPTGEEAEPAEAPPVRLTAARDGAGGETRFEYADDGRLRAVHDSDGGGTRYDLAEPPGVLRHVIVDVQGPVGAVNWWKPPPGRCETQRILSLYDAGGGMTSNVYDWSAL